MARARRHRIWPRSLRGQLAAWFLLLLLVAAVVIGVVTAVFLQSFLVNRLDQQLAQAGGRYSTSLEHGRIAPGGNDGDADNAVPGQSPGTLGVRLVEGRVSQAAVVDPDGRNAAVRFDAADVRHLAALAPGAGPRTVDLSSLGDYRVQAVQGRDGDVQITGLPLRPVHETLARLAAVEISVFAGVVVVGGAVGLLLIRRITRPLERLTTTARAVSELPLTAADTQLPRPVAPAHPASEIEHLDAAFTHMLDNVHEALTERDATEGRLRQFVADASHELRTPLATIRANADYLARPDVDPTSEDAPRAVARIAGAAERMGSLVSDLLLLARLDAGRPLERREVDLTRLVLDGVSDARTAHPGHRWRLELPSEIVLVDGDEQRLHQVLTNLLTNAGVHTPPGTTVTTRLTAGPQTAAVEVVDDGPGIALGRQNDLFERFTRGDSSRSREHGSTGLGLAIARGIAVAHGGTLTASSTVGQGTCFRLTLPRSDAWERPEEALESTDHLETDDTVREP